MTILSGSSAHFADLVRRYCELIEGPEPDSREIFAQELLRLLLDLYRGALDLDDVESSGAESERAISHEQWEEIRERIARRIDRDYYWMASDPFDMEKEQAFCCGSLSDDLADIYRDLKVGLLGLEGGETGQRVVWRWKFHFQIHWGRHHAANAISALNALLLSS